MGRIGQRRVGRSKNRATQSRKEREEYSRAESSLDRAPGHFPLVKELLTPPSVEHIMFEDSLTGGNVTNVT